MTEFVFLLSLTIVAAIAAGLLLRALVQQSTCGLESQRVLAAISRAGSDTLWLLGKPAALTLAALLACVVGVSISPLGDWTSGLWLGAGVLSGTVLTFMGGQLGFRVTMLATPRIVRSLELRSEATLPLALRAAGSAVLLLEALAILPALGSIGWLLLLDASGWLEATHGLRLLNAGVALGAISAAQLGQLAGSSLTSSAEAGNADPRLNPKRLRYKLHPKNPLMVVAAMAPGVGSAHPRAQDALSLNLLANGLLLSLLLPFLPNGAEAALALLILPFLVRACSWAATALVMVAFNVQELDNPSDLIFRGQIATAFITFVALVGTCRWLLPGAQWLALMLAMAAGWAAQLTLSALQQFRANRTGPRAVLSSNKRGPGALMPGLADGLGGSLGQVTVDLALVGSSLVAAAYLGANTGHPGGETLALLLGMAGFLLGSSYSTALALSEPITQSAVALLSASGSADMGKDPHLAGVDSAATTLGAGGRSWLIGATGATTFAGAVLFTGAPTLTSAGTLPLLAGVLGLSLVAGHAGVALRYLARAAFSSTQELDRQLKHLSPQPDGAIAFPDDFSPRYKEHLLAATVSAQHNLFPLTLGAIVSPWVLAALFIWVAKDEQQLLAPLSMLLTFAALAGVALSWTADATWSAVCVSAKPQPSKTEVGQTALLAFLLSARSIASHQIARSVVTAGLSLSIILTQTY